MPCKLLSTSFVEKVKNGINRYGAHLDNIKMNQSETLISQSWIQKRKRPLCKRQ